MHDKEEKKGREKGGKNRGSNRRKKRKEVRAHVFPLRSRHCLDQSKIKQPISTFVCMQDFINGHIR